MAVTIRSPAGIAPIAATPAVVASVPAIMSAGRPGRIALAAIAPMRLRHRSERE